MIAFCATPVARGAPAPAQQIVVAAFNPVELSYDLGAVGNPFPTNHLTLADLQLSDALCQGTYPLIWHPSGPTANVTSPANPFLHFRFSLEVLPPNGGDRVVVPGFYAGDGTTGSTASGLMGFIGTGAHWKVRFTPDERVGTWTVRAFMEVGTGTPVGTGGDGRPINVSDDPTPATLPSSVPSNGVIWVGPSVSVKVLERNPLAPGHYGKGFLRSDPDASRYLVYHRSPNQESKERFLKIGVNSPENWFGYQGFYRSKKDPRFKMNPNRLKLRYPDFSVDGSGLGEWHTFRHVPHPDTGHESRGHHEDHATGDPNWLTTRTLVQETSQGSNNLSDSDVLLVDAGAGIIGALNYLSRADHGLNSIYVIPMNLGGDGWDTYPYLDVDLKDLSPNPSPTPGAAFNSTPEEPRFLFNHSIRRMHEWNLVLGHAMAKGFLVQLVLHEHEQANMKWHDYDWNSITAAPVHRSGSAAKGLHDARRLYLKQMVAHFGHHPGIQWNLCEENWHLPSAPGVELDFTIAQLRGMARWIERWDAMHDHPIAVHSHGNHIALYTDIASDSANNPPWLDVTSFYIYGSEPQTLHSNSAASGGSLYSALTEQLRNDLLAVGPAGARVAISVDEPGEWKYGSAGTNNRSAIAPYASLMSSPEGRRRLVLWDVLVSGAGGFEHYIGYGRELDGFLGVLTPGLTSSPNDFEYRGGTDISVESFRYLSGHWRNAFGARKVLNRVPFWLAEPADGAVTGEHGDNTPGDDDTLNPYGQAEVLGYVVGAPAVRGFYLIYYPNAYDSSSQALPLGMLHVANGAGSQSGAAVQFYHPVTGDPAPSPPLYIDSIQTAVVLSAPPASVWGASPPRDLACIVTILP